MNHPNMQWTGKRVLIPLKCRDRVEEIVPYLKKIAQPGMRVVFLIPYPVGASSCRKILSASQAMLSGRDPVYRYSWNTQRALAEWRVSAARETLWRLDVEVAVHVYAGGLTKALAAYKDNEETPLMILPLTSGRFWKAVIGRISFLGLFKRARSSGVVLVDV